MKNSVHVQILLLQTSNIAQIDEFFLWSFGEYMFSYIFTEIVKIGFLSTLLTARKTSQKA